VWEAVAGINLAQVSDTGAAFGAAGNQQGDARFGDIRIGGVPLSGSVLATAYLPPPINGGTLAGDIVFNTNQAWKINSDYDVLTVAIHEMGHALGMDHSAISTADMYASYNAVKQATTIDDTLGIQTVYGGRRADGFEGLLGNNLSLTAAAIAPYLDANKQAALPGLDITTVTDADWFYVAAPAGSSGTLTVSMQSTNLSELSPKVLVYNAALQGLGSDAKVNAYGATATVTVTGVSAGQGFFIKAMAANGGVTGVGGYGLLVNFGTGTQPPIDPPDTIVAEQPDQGGGSSNQGYTGPFPWVLGHGKPEWLAIGDLVGYGDRLTVSPHHAPTHQPRGPAHAVHVDGYPDPATLTAWDGALNVLGHDASWFVARFRRRPR
jgi:hypothetical protein